MHQYDTERLPVELAEVAQELRDERPTATAIELDHIKLRVQSRTRRPAPKRERFMRSRLAMMAMLAVGVLALGTGTAGAISGLSGDGSAGVAQYNTPNGQANIDSGNPAQTGNGAQTTRQLQANGPRGLAFTGYAAIPVLLAGLALLGMGITMRRRVSHRRQS